VCTDPYSCVVVTDVCGFQSCADARSTMLALPAVSISGPGQRPHCGLPAFVRVADRAAMLPTGPRTEVRETVCMVSQSQVGSILRA
jgi:hypothetical protein